MQLSANNYTKGQFINQVDVFYSSSELLLEFFIQGAKSSSNIIIHFPCIFGVLLFLFSIKTDQLGVYILKKRIAFIIFTLVHFIDRTPVTLFIFINEK